MRQDRHIPKAIRIAILSLQLIGPVLAAASCSGSGTLAAFLKNIDYYGRTKGEMEQRLGTPNGISRNVTGPFVTMFYYDGLVAVFDDYAGGISALSITDGRWTVDDRVSIGAPAAEVAAALGDGYFRLTDAVGRDVWVYFCPRPSSDGKAALCNYCRVCYITFTDGRVSKIEWSTELRGGYE
jgi:hypothetical protein